MFTHGSCWIESIVKREISCCKLDHVGCCVEVKLAKYCHVLKNCFVLNHRINPFFVQNMPDRVLWREYVKEVFDINIACGVIDLLTFDPEKPLHLQDIFDIETKNILSRLGLYTRSCLGYQLRKSFQKLGDTSSKGFSWRELISAGYVVLPTRGT